MPDVQQMVRPNVAFQKVAIDDAIGRFILGANGRIGLVHHAGFGLIGISPVMDRGELWGDNVIIPATPYLAVSVVVGEDIGLPDDRELPIINSGNEHFWTGSMADDHKTLDLNYRNRLYCEPLRL